MASTSEWTTGHNLDDILNSLSSERNETKAASPESEWFAGLSDHEKKVMDRLALFEGRV